MKGINYYATVFKCIVDVYLYKVFCPCGYRRTSFSFYSFSPNRNWIIWLKYLSAMPLLKPVRKWGISDEFCPDEAHCSEDVRYTSGCETELSFIVYLIRPCAMLTHMLKPSSIHMTLNLTKMLAISRHIHKSVRMLQRWSLLSVPLSLCSFTFENLKHL